MSTAAMVALIVGCSIVAEDVQGQGTDITGIWRARQIIESGCVIYQILDDDKSIDDEKLSSEMTLTVWKNQFIVGIAGRLDEDEPRDPCWQGSG